MTSVSVRQDDARTVAGAGARPLPDVPGVVHRFVTARGARFHVAQAGAGDPVVLLHGLPLHWYAWRKVIPELAGEYRLFCIDLRGCGWSEGTRRGYSTGEQVRDVLAVMDALGLERVRLIGHDSGGWLGFALCLYAPGIHQVPAPALGRRVVPVGSCRTGGVRRGEQDTIGVAGDSAGALAVRAA